MSRTKASCLREIVVVKACIFFILYALIDPRYRRFAALYILRRHFSTGNLPEYQSSPAKAIKKGVLCENLIAAVKSMLYMCMYMCKYRRSVWGSVMIWRLNRMDINIILCKLD